MKPAHKNSLEPFKFHLEMQPRFSDMDAYGHLNNAKYFTYFEEGRVAYVSHLGIFLPRQSTVSFVIQEASCRYRAPIHHRHLVRIYLRTAEWTKTRFRFYYVLWLPQDDILAAEGSTLAVAYDLKTRKPVPIPGDFLETMQYFEEESESRDQ